MIVKSIQITDNDINIAYQKPSATGLTDVFTIKSKDDPRPELMQAFSRLQAIMKKNFEFLEEFNIPFVVRSFKFKYGVECVRFIAGKRAQGNLFTNEE